jgi:4-hydroxythreonine-4-phosphate dehydrogenase
MNEGLPFLITVGEPAGIGPDLIIALSYQSCPIPWVALCDPQLLRERAKLLNQKIELIEYVPDGFRAALDILQKKAQGKEYKKPTVSIISIPGRIYYFPISLPKLSTPGILEKENVSFVLKSLECAVKLCKKKEVSGLVTGPVHKSIIQKAGIPFIGQTEFLGQLCEVEYTVMMLMCAIMKVALVTTHLPLGDVPKAITREKLKTTLEIIHQELQDKFAIKNPRLTICGLNPHAGENGFLGHEEIDVIIPVIQELQEQGYQILGPLPADTAFLPYQLQQCDVVVAMYHDQGLSVLKYAGFGQAVNVTLGLPLIRTSVDHGTALSLAGTGKAEASSLVTALETAQLMARNTML